MTDAAGPAGPWRRPEVAARPLDGVLVLLDEVTGRSASLEGSAAALWERFDGETGVDGIAAEVADATGAGREALRQQVGTLVETLTAAGFLERNGRPAAAPGRSAAGDGGAAEPRDSAPSDACFAVLEHHCSVTCPDRELLAEIRSVLGPFEAGAADDGPAAPTGTRYAVVRGPTERVATPYGLLVDGAWVAGSGDPAHVLDHLFWHVNQVALGRATRHVVVHAGAVAHPDGGAVVLPAVSGSGKSTLVAGLVAAGFGYLSDEAAPVDPGTGVVTPFPKALSMKADSPARRLVVPAAGRPASATEWHVAPESLRPGSVAAGPEPVRAVVFPRFVAGAETVLAPMSRPEACVELTRHLLNLGRGVSAATTLRALDVMTRDATCWRLEHGDLASSVAAVEEALRR